MQRLFVNIRYFLLMSICGSSPHVVAEDGFLTLGPLRNDQIAAVESVLVANDVDYSSRQQDAIESLGFIVVTPRQPSAQVGNRIIELLKAAGESDLLYIKAGEYQARISAGVFATRERANRRANGLQGRGFDFSVIERGRRVSQIVIEVNSRPNEALVRRLQQIIPVDQFVRHNDRFQQPTATRPTPNETPSEATSGPTSKTVPEVAPIDQNGSLDQTVAPPNEAADSPTKPRSPMPSEAPPTAELSPIPMPTENAAEPREPRPGVVYWGLLVLMALTIAVLIYLVVRYRRAAGAEGIATFLPFKPERAGDPARIPAEAAPKSHEKATEAFDLDDLARHVLDNPQHTGVMVQWPGGDDSTMLDSVLLLARINSGAEPVHDVSFDPASLFEDINQQARGLADARGISLNYNAPDRLPPLVSSDPGKITRIVQTLLHHCIQNTDSGRVILTADFEPALAMLDIEITYPGDVEEKDLFDITTHNGLKLIVAQRLTELLGGDLSATHMSDHSWTLSISVKANALDLPTTPLPGGQTLEEFIAEAERSREESEVRLAAIGQAEAEATAEAEQRAITERQLGDEIERLNAELTSARQRATVETGKINDVESAAVARVTALERDLEETRRSLATETRRREAADAAAETAKDALGAEMTAVKAAAAQAQETYRAMIDESNLEIQSLSMELEHSTERLEAEVLKQAARENDAEQRLKALETDLGEARLQAEKEASIRMSAEQQASDAVARLTQELLAARQQQSETGVRLAGQNRQTEEIAQLQEALTNAQSRLDEESELRARAEAEAGEQVRALLAQSQDARREADEQSTSRARLQAQVDEVRVEMQRIQTEHEHEKATLAASLEKSRNEIDAAHQSREQAEIEAKKQVEAIRSELLEAREEASRQLETLTESEQTLHQRIKEARAQASAEISARQRAQQAADENVAMLNQRLAKLKDGAIKQARQHKMAESGARQVVQSLRAKLDSLTASEQSRQSESSEEIDELRNSLAAAQEQLDRERQRQGRDENATGEQIGSLLDELNGAKSSAANERRLREEAEQNSLEMVNALERELAETREALNDESARREELEQAAEKDSQRMAQHLTNAMEHAAELQSRHEKAAEALLKTNAELTQARDEAANHARAEAEARAELSKLKARLAVLEKSPPILRQESDEAPSKARPSATDNPIIFTRMKRFLQRLEEQIKAMQSAYNREQYLDLVVICNWLKNETQSLRLKEFEAPIREIELQLRNQHFSQILPQIEALNALASQIDFDPTEAPDIISFPFAAAPAQLEETPVTYPLPRNERKAELLENFVSQLGSQLLEMQEAWQHQDANQVNKNCKWILKYASRMNFLEVVYATEDLQEALTRGDAADISIRLTEFINLYTRIDLVRAA